MATESQKSIEAHRRMEEFDREVSDLRLTQAHFVEMTIHLALSAAKHLVEFLRCLRGGLRWLKVALKATLRLLHVALVRLAFRFWAIRLLKARCSCPESDAPKPGDVKR